MTKPPPPVPHQRLVGFVSNYKGHNLRQQRQNTDNSLCDTSRTAVGGGGMLQRELQSSRAHTLRQMRARKRVVEFVFCFFALRTPAALSYLTQPRSAPPRSAPPVHACGVPAVTRSTSFAAGTHSTKSTSRCSTRWTSTSLRLCSATAMFGPQVDPLFICHPDLCLIGLSRCRIARVRPQLRVSAGASRRTRVQQDCQAPVYLPACMPFLPHRPLSHVFSCSRLSPEARRLLAAIH